jgi:hypothetical protein
VAALPLRSEVTLAFANEGVAHAVRAGRGAMAEMWVRDLLSRDLRGLDSRTVGARPKRSRVRNKESTTLCYPTELWEAWRDPHPAPPPRARDGSASGLSAYATGYGQPGPAVRYARSIHLQAPSCAAVPRRIGHRAYPKNQSLVLHGSGLRGRPDKYLPNSAAPRQ